MRGTNERRANPRHRVALDGRWQTRSGLHSAKISDLSHGGCFVQTSVMPPPDERLHLVFQLSAFTSLTAEVVIAHRSASGFGARFVALTDDQRLILTSALDELASKARD